MYTPDESHLAGGPVFLVLGLPSPLQPSPLPLPRPPSPTLVASSLFSHLHLTARYCFIYSPHFLICRSVSSLDDTSFSIHYQLLGSLTAFVVRNSNPCERIGTSCSPGLLCHSIAQDVDVCFSSRLTLHFTFDSDVSYFPYGF